MYCLQLRECANHGRDKWRRPVRREQSGGGGVGWGIKLVYTTWGESGGGGQGEREEEGGRRGMGEGLGVGVGRGRVGGRRADAECMCLTSNY